MKNIWIVCDDHQVAAQLMTLAQALAERKDINFILAGGDGADKLAALGPARVYHIKPQDNRPESACKTIAKCLRDNSPSLVIFGATPRGRGMAATIAALLESGMASEISGVTEDNGKLAATRYIYGGKGVETVSILGIPCVTVESNVFAWPEAGAEKAEVNVIEAPADPAVKVVKTVPAQREGADLSAAEKVVGVGRGVQKREDLRLAEDLATVLNAELACSRGLAEDLKWLPLDRYIGISGAKIRANLYISAGISGQVQHVAGIRDAKIIVGIDSNENAPIFAAADYGIVGDLYEVLPALGKALGA